MMFDSVISKKMSDIRQLITGDEVNLPPFHYELCVTWQSPWRHW